MKEIDKFIDLIVKLEPIEFMGLARVLGVKLNEDDKPRDFEPVFAEVLERFSKCNRTRRHELLKLVKTAIKEVKNAGNT